MRAVAGAVPTERGSGNGVAVLVAEGDSTSRELLEYYLGRTSWRTVVVTTGEEAHRHLRSERFDVAVLDVSLEHRSGFDLLREIRDDKQLSHTRVMLLSEDGRDGTELKAFELGASDFVRRPFAPAVVVARVKRLLIRRNGAMGEQS